MRAIRLRWRLAVLLAVAASVAAAVAGPAIASANTGQDYCLVHGVTVHRDPDINSPSVGFVNAYSYNGEKWHHYYSATSDAGGRWSEGYIVATNPNVRGFIPYGNIEEASAC